MRSLSLFSLYGTIRTDLSPLECEDEFGQESRGECEENFHDEEVKSETDTADLLVPHST
jgi:hypothetical protein